MNFIDKYIFLNNYNDVLTSGNLIVELEEVARVIKRSMGTDAKYPSIPKNQIQRLKQVVWILEANNKKYER